MLLTNVNQLWAFDSRANLPYKVNSLWKIQYGMVRGFTWLDDGTMITLGVWGPGDTVSKSFAKVNPYELECVTEVKAALISWYKGADMTNILLSHIQPMQELTIIRSQKTVEAMLIQLFNWLGKKFGTETSKGQLIDFRLTHQDLADILGTTRVTITRSLSQLEKQGFIQRNPLHRFILREEQIWHYEI